MKKKVLFLCTGNSCRSQMAEGWLRHLAGDRFDVVSAGTHPVGLNPYAVEVMREIDVDISNHVSERVDPYFDQQFDYVITVCNQAQEACPIFPGAASMLHWSFEDPAKAKGTYEQQVIVFRKIRDEIANQIRHFIAEEKRKDSK
ncbi:MAG TPA: arsenate reductase ArsC [Nitrospiraceae bacterium]|nr:arsenate reductase ArsC [Nitrospiraceae bacterium]